MGTQATPDPVPAAPVVPDPVPVARVVPDPVLAAQPTPLSWNFWGQAQPSPL